MVLSAVIKGLFMSCRNVVLVQNLRCGLPVWCDGSGGASGVRNSGAGLNVRADKAEANKCTCATIVKTARRVWRLARPMRDLCRS